METYPRGTLVNLLYQAPLPIFNLRALQTLFQTKSRSTLNTIIHSLVSQQVLKSLAPGQYYLTTKPPDTFTIANILTQPSYISFESALNYHNILPQIPMVVTSATLKKPLKKDVQGVTYIHHRLQNSLFFGYTYTDQALIATPEKALLDQLYYTTKKYRLIDWDEYSLDLIDKYRLVEYLSLFQETKGYPSIKKTLKEHNLC
jgi:predicted transcriptional regulator of viral defense system